MQEVGAGVLHCFGPESPLHPHMRPRLDTVKRWTRPQMPYRRLVVGGGENMRDVFFCWCATSSTNIVNNNDVLGVRVYNKEFRVEPALSRDVPQLAAPC